MTKKRPRRPFYQKNYKIILSNSRASTKVAKEALETNRSVYDIVLENGILTKEELDKALDPKNMIR